MLRHVMPSDVGGTFQLGHRGPGAAGPPRTAPASWGRHGSGARTTTADAGYGGMMGITPPSSVSPRRRLRDETDQRGREQSREGRRTRRDAPQHGMDTDDELSKLMNRINTAETTLRQQAHQIATNTQQIQTLAAAQDKEVEDRKDLDERMRLGGERIADRISQLETTYGAKLIEVEQMVHSVIAGMHTVNAGVQGMQEQFRTHTPGGTPIEAVPAMHNLGTADPRIAAQLAPETPSPWGQNAHN